MPTKAEQLITDRLIYQSSNEYRMHADNLRWSLLAGFAVFLAAVAGLSQSGSGSIQITDPLVSCVAFIVSFAYFWILAVQNWFYNLFADWVNDSATRLVTGERVRTMIEFAKAEGSAVTPFHPAFILAEIVVGSVAYYFLANTLIVGVPSQLVAVLQCFSLAPGVGWFIGFFLYFLLHNVIFLRWDSMVYRPVIQPLSNLYRQEKQRKKSA